MKIQLSEIQKAERSLKQYLSPTPLLFSSWLSDLLKCEVFLKLENMQPVGSYKIRGATNKILSLSEKERKKGVIAASAGNHAQGVAWGARSQKVKSLIVMPVGAPLTKIQNTLALGAEVKLSGELLSDSVSEAKKIARKTGKVFIHPFEDQKIISGQGTIGLELLKQLPDADFIIGSMAGGGMMAGIGTVIKALRPKTKLIGCQVKGADPIVQSIRKGKSVKLSTVKTFADGIAVRVSSPKMIQLLKKKIDAFYTADDEATAAAVLMLAEKAKIVAEGAAALPLAVLCDRRNQFKGKKVILVVSGGNIDVNVLARILDRGLIRAGRRIRLNVLISDAPGSLNALTTLIKEEGANVIQVIHDRHGPSTQIDQTGVALTLETRGPKHTKKLVKAIESHAIRVEAVS